MCSSVLSETCPLDITLAWDILPPFKKHTKNPKKQKNKKTKKKEHKITLICAHLSRDIEYMVHLFINKNESIVISDDIDLSIYLSIYVSSYLSIYLSIYLSRFSSINLYFSINRVGSYMSLYMSVYISRLIYLSIYLS